MPIKIPNLLPATEVLESENIFVITETRAIHQDIRPLQILLLNLMPTKIVTETQLARMLSNTPLQVELELLQMRSHQSKNVSQEHMLTFYKTFDQVKHRKFDGMIITGAPVELKEFEEVDYWQELCEIMEWSKSNVHSTFHICWGAQAALYYHFGIPKVEGARGILVCQVAGELVTLSEKRRRPAVLVIPGGGYTFTSEREAEPIAMHFLTRGYGAFTLYYTCAPQGFPVALREAAMAMRLNVR